MPQTQSSDAKVFLAGVALDAISEARCVERIVAASLAGEGGWVVTVNADILRRLHRDTTFVELTEPATLRVADGMPLIWAAKAQGTPLPERVAGSNLISSLSAKAATTGRSVFLFGGDPGTADQAAAILQQRHPNLKIAGTYCPAMGFERDAQAMAAMREKLVNASPDIVYIALGSPKQERVIAQWREALPGAWWLGVGISFSFLCGHVQRAPRWMQVVGLEWLHRLCQQPGRLARRYLVDDLPFVGGLLLGALRNRRRPAGHRRGGGGAGTR